MGTILYFNEELHKYTNQDGLVYTSMTTVIGRYEDKFDTEVVDPEWSYEQSNNIRGTLNDLLSKQGFWIESLECKSSACKLKVSSGAEFKSFAPGVSNVLRELKLSEWPKESLNIVNIIKNDDVKSAEIMIIRKL